MIKRFVPAVIAVILVMASAAFGADFPVSYDPRPLSLDTPVKNQGAWGLCWSFATMEAIESSYLHKLRYDSADVSEAYKLLGGVESVDLSELHLGWYYRNHPDRRWRETGVNPRTVTLATLAVGANLFFPVAYLTRLDGPALESNLPYLSRAVLEQMGYSGKVPDVWSAMNQFPSYELFQIVALNTPLIGHKLLPELNQYPTDPASFDRPLRITDALYGTEDPYGLDTENQNRRLINKDFVKQLITDYGAAAIAYHVKHDTFDLNTSPDVIPGYYVNNSNVNHAVSIVGWDDNYSVDNFHESYRPAEKGAWLVKNSWGTAWPRDPITYASFDEIPSEDKGYFYMSYEQPIQGGLVFNVEDRPNNLRLYLHDPLGLCYFFGQGSTMWAANNFKVLTDDEKLEAISFYTTEAGAEATWWVYYNMAGKPSAKPYDESSARISGSETFPYAGYHTVKITPQVPLTKGTYFTVVLKITNPKTTVPMAIECKMERVSEFAVVHDGESWFSYDGQDWWDGMNTTDGRRSLPMNATIKAFTLGDGTGAISDDMKKIFGNYVVSASVYLSAADVSNAQLSGVAPNSNIPDEPLSRRWIYVPETMSGDTSTPYEKGTEIYYYLVNVTQAHEFVEVYVSSEDTSTPYGKGLLPYDENNEPVPLFEEGYEPDLFFETSEGLEAPAYGPFEGIVSDDGLLLLDVQDLNYISGDVGSIPKGYYEFVYFGWDLKNNNFTGKLPAGKLELRLEGTDHSVTSPDVIYVDRDVVSREVIHTVSHDYIGAGTSSGCSSVGISAAGIVLLAGIAFASKKRS